MVAPDSTRQHLTPADGTLPWARAVDYMLGRQCAAVRERRAEPSAPYFGRCELRRGHHGDHALDRGLDVMRWSTDWTSPWIHSQRHMAAIPHTAPLGAPNPTNPTNPGSSSEGGKW